MRKQIIIFFSVFFSLYGLLNSYIFWRGYEAVIAAELMPAGLYTTFFLILALSFFLGRTILKRTQVFKAGSFFRRIAIAVGRSVTFAGALWLGAMVYLLIFLLLFDFVRLMNYIFAFLPNNISAPALYSPNLWFYIISGTTGLILIAGYINARSVRIKSIELALPQGSSITEPVRFTVLSDIHLGALITKRYLQQIIRKVNQTQPQFVLIAGDVFDEDISLVIEEGCGDLFKNIIAPQGIFVIPGNHEYFGGVEKAAAYLRASGLIVLRDESAIINNLIAVTGRDDLSFNRSAGKKRKTLKNLLADIPKGLLTIVLDHQPSHIQESIDLGVYLQISGHTHHGQLFPFNLITRKVHPLSYGYKKFGSTNFYVSCGVGTWGPPIRTNARPEIVSFILT